MRTLANLINQIAISVNTDFGKLNYHRHREYTASKSKETFPADSDDMWQTAENAI